MNPLSANPWLPTGVELELFAPELVLVGTLIALLAVPLFAGRKPHVAAIVTLSGAVVGLLAMRPLIGRVAAGGLGGLSPAGVAPMLLADGFTVFFKLLLFGFLILIVWLWLIGANPSRDRQASGASGAPPASVNQTRDGPGLATRAGGPEFFVLLLTSALGMMLMVSTLNLLVMIIAIEMASLPSYAIVASDKRSRVGAEAALKYVMFGAASAAIMVYGVSLLYGRFGTLDVAAIARSLAFTNVGHGMPAVDVVTWLAFVAIGVGIAFKIAAVPMHLWCPDVFEGAPIEITTWLSVASKAAGLGLLLRLGDALGVASSPGQALAALSVGIGVLAAITCTVGNLAALRQESVKRTLAYSSIAHAGYMMMAGAMLARPTPAPPTNVAVAAVVAYLLVYVVMNLGAFGATALVVWQTGTDRLAAFTGLGRRAPWIALPLAVCLFSLVGLPPLGGFAAKWFLLLALGKMADTQPWLWGLVIVAVLNTAISLYYYVRIIRQMYLVDDAQLPAWRPPLGGVTLVNACAVMLLLLGTLWFSPLGERATRMASGLFEPLAMASRFQGDATCVW